MGYFLLGFYCTIGLVTFLYILFLVMLGGKETDLWKPFVFGPLWPLFWLFWFHRF